MENIELENKEEESRTIVRLRTSYWSNKRGAYKQKELVIMRSKCIGYNLIEDEISATDATDVISRITNLDECEDGVYEIFTCDEHRDYAGYVDDYNYHLSPYAEEATPQPQLKKQGKKMQFKITKTIFGELNPGDLFIFESHDNGEIDIYDSERFNAEFNDEESNNLNISMKCNSTVLESDAGLAVFLIERA